MAIWLMQLQNKLRSDRMTLLLYYYQNNVRIRNESKSLIPQILLAQGKPLNSPLCAFVIVQTDSNRRISLTFTQLQKVSSRNLTLVHWQAAYTPFGLDGWKPLASHMVHLKKRRIFFRSPTKKFHSPVPPRPKTPLYLYRRLFSPKGGKAICQTSSPAHPASQAASEK
jgi:hypothetical protein